jgi:hypothetical protein
MPSGGAARAGDAPAGVKPAIAGIVALAIALRVWHLAQGLPDFVEEAIPLRKALGMWGYAGRPADLNPHLFHYPSLTLYLQLLVQKLHFLAGHALGRFASPADYLLAARTDPTNVVLLGRLVSVAADALSVACVAAIGERLRRGAGLLAALLVACAPGLVVAGRSIYTDTVMTALALAALERMLAWRVAGGRGRLVAAVVLVGLAAGAKYPAASLLLPLGVVLWARAGARGLALWPACAALALAVFLVTTPYALLDFSTFARDFGFVSGLAARGHLGNLDRPGFHYHLANLARDVGWIGVGLAALSPLLLVRVHRDGPRRGDLLALLVALLAFGVPIALARVEAERYLIPVVPLAALLAGLAVFAGPGALRGRWRVPALALAIAALALPALARGVRVGASGGGSTQLEARRWCERNLGRDRILVEEAFGAAPLTRQARLETMAGALYAAAGPEARRRFETRPWYRIEPLPLTVAGRALATVMPPGRPPVELEIFPHVVDLNQMLYEPRLLEGVDYVLTSAAVRGRYAADPGRFPVQAAFYALLDSTAELAARIRPDAAHEGPEIAIYRLSDRARGALAALGPLDTLWWAARIPLAYREAAGALLEPGTPPDSSVRDAAGRPTAWVASLGPMFADRIATFTVPLASDLAELGRFGPARRLAAATLAVVPGDLAACLLYTTAAGRAGEWRAAKAAIERTLAAIDAEGEPPDVLRLEHAEILERLGETRQARAELEAVAAAGGGLAGEARRRLAARRSQIPQPPRNPRR